MIQTMKTQTKNLQPLTTRHLEVLNPGWWSTENITLFNQPFTLDKYPFMVELYNMAHHPDIVVKKAAQLAFTTYGINTTLWFIKNPLLIGNAIYIFPTEGQVYDFTNARLNPIIEDSPAFSNSDQAKVDNMGLKRFGNGKVIYFRGAKSDTKLVEMPANWQVLDEVDKYDNPDIVSLVKERASGFSQKYFKYLSNPTFPDIGIDALYNDSTMAEYYLKCDACGKEQSLHWDKNIDINDPERGVFCKYCGAPMDRLARGRWIHHKKLKRLGYTLNQLYSPTVTPQEMIEAFKRCRGEYDMQVFYNMKLGLAYTPKGGKLTDDDLNKATQKDRERGEYSGTLFGGVDVGSFLDWVIIDKDGKVIDWGRAKDPAEVIRKFKEYGVFSFVIDALPETRMSIEICTALPARGSICYFTEKDNEQESDDGEYNILNRNRSLWIDRAFHSIRIAEITFPREIIQDTHFREHMKNLIRVVKEAKDDKDKTITFVRNGKPDHLMLALVYAFIAKERFTDVGVDWV